jgi:hypothetical protein
MRDSFDRFLKKKRLERASVPTRESLAGGDPKKFPSPACFAIAFGHSVV